jgi:anti-sigma factor RsiW
MKPCESFQVDLDAFLEQTLERERQLDLERHLQHCNPCRETLQQEQAIKQELRDTSANWHPSENLWSRISESASLESRESPSSRRTLGQLPRMAAALLLITVGVFGFTLLTKTEQLSSDVVASALVNEFHTFVVSRRDLDYNDTQPVKIRQWFGNKVDFRVPLPLKSRSLDLAGGRLCNMLDQRIASFMYRVDDAWVSLYIMRSTAGRKASGDSNEILLRGYGYIDWENQGLHYSLVGDIPVERLRRIAEQLRSTRILAQWPAVPTAPVMQTSAAHTPAIA